MPLSYFNLLKIASLMICCPNSFTLMHNLQLHIFIQQKNLVSSLMEASNTVAKMALKTMLPGETPIIVERPGGSTVVQKNDVSAFLDSSYSVGGATVDITNNLGVNSGILDFKVSIMIYSISYLSNTLSCYC